MSGTSCYAGLLFLLLLPVLSSADDAQPPVALKITRAAIERGSLTVSLQWPSGGPALPREAVTVVILLQGKSDPPAVLDAALLSQQGQAWESGVLTNNCTWFLRPVRIGETTAHVLQLVPDDAAKPNVPDFRKSADFPINLQMAFVNRVIPHERAQVGLFEQADLKKQHEASTSYRALSNVVEIGKLSD